MKNSLEIGDHPIKSIYFEPGRYFVGDAGLYITKVTNIKEGRWIFLNVGNNICPKFARCTLRFYNASNINSSHKYKTNFAGIIPTDQDILAKNYYFTEELKKNDRVLITNVGAYCITFSNRFPYLLPSIYLIRNNGLIQIYNPNNKNERLL